MTTAFRILDNQFHQMEQKLSEMLSKINNDDERTVTMDQVGSVSLDT